MHVRLCESSAFIITQQKRFRTPELCDEAARDYQEVPIQQASLFLPGLINPSRGCVFAGADEHTLLSHNVTLYASFPSMNTRAYVSGSFSSCSKHLPHKYPARKRVAITSCLQSFFFFLPLHLTSPVALKCSHPAVVAKLFSERRIFTSINNNKLHI